eukprot:497867-Prymnesium_polylepis.1
MRVPIWQFFTEVVHILGARLLHASDADHTFGSTAVAIPGRADCTAVQRTEINRSGGCRPFQIR